MNVKKTATMAMTLATAIPFATTVATASAATVPGTPAAVTWAYEAVTPAHTYTLEQAVAAAQSQDVIVAMKNTFAKYVPAMEAANPNLKLLVYVNGAYAYKDQGSIYPSSWYLHDASGAKIRSGAYGNYLMDVTNPGWIQTVTAECQQALATDGYQGCFLDMLGPASVLQNYGSGVPVDATGAPISVHTWLAETTALAADVKKALGPNQIVYGNGLSNGTAFASATAPTSVLLGTLDGGLSETWLRTAGAPLTTYPTTKAWLASLNLVTAGDATGRQVMLTVKTWAPGTAAQIAAWHAFSVGSYLLVADGTAAYEFLPSVHGETTTPDSILTGLNLGTATGSYTLTGGAYQRTFSNGLVIVNPGTTTVTVPVTGTYTDQNGAAVSGSLVMAPDTAEILTIS
jgi:Hypothetical glycosyl hydrolase family 15